MTPLDILLSVCWVYLIGVAVTGVFYTIVRLMVLNSKPGLWFAVALTAVLWPLFIAFCITRWGRADEP